MKNYPYEITTINCNICNKNYFKASASLIKGECTCFDCFVEKYYDIKNNNGVFSDLFKQITDETSYILGRLFIPFVWSEQGIDSEEEIVSVKFSEENINSVNFLKLLVLCKGVTYKKIKTIHTFNIYKKDIEDLMSAFNFQKIKLVLKTEENMNLFLRGVVEQYALLITSEMLLEISPRSSIVLKYLSELNNNCILTSVSLAYEKLNCLDFLGKIYKSKLYLIDNWFYGQYILMNDTYSSSKTKFSYCKVLKTDDNAVIPFKTNLSDVGFDLTIIKKVKDLTFNTALYDTGIIVEPPKGFYVEIHPRSSLSKSGYMLANSTGIIDPGYRNTLMIALTKVDVSSPNLELPFKCCQMIIKRHEIVQLVEVTDINSQTSRGLGGFGSTG